MKLTDAQRKFFEVEIRNEEKGGERPATLDSAYNSADQAPIAVLEEWCGEEALSHAQFLSDLCGLIVEVGEKTTLQYLLDEDITRRRKEHDDFKNEGAAMPKLSELAFFAVRVKLPNSSGYASCPSGDTDYECDYQKTLDDATPPGFKVKPLRVGQHWPKDSEGYTWVQLECIDEKNTVAEVMMAVTMMADRMQQIRALADQIRDAATSPGG